MRPLFQLWIVLLIVFLKLYDLMIYREGWKIKSLNLDEVYVINLDSSRSRLDRISTNLAKYDIPFRRFSAVHGLGLQIYDLMNRGKVVDVENFDWSLSLNSKVQHLVYYPRIPEAAFIADSTFGLPKGSVYGYFTPGELGCLYSHRAVWCDIVRHKHRAALILEDDVSLYGGFRDIIRDSISEIPQDADLVLVDFWEYRAGISSYSHSVQHCEGDVLLLPASKNVGVLKAPERYTLGAYAYIVTSKGAKKLLEITSRTKRCVDVIMMEGRASGKLNVYFFRPKMLKSSWGASEISRLGRNKYEKKLFTRVEVDTAVKSWRGSLKWIQR